MILRVQKGNSCQGDYYVRYRSSKDKYKAKTKHLTFGDWNKGNRFPRYLRDVKNAVYKYIMGAIFQIFQLG